MGYGNTASNLPTTGIDLIAYAVVAVAIVVGGLMLRKYAAYGDDR